ncbi:hypothetical protein Aperf_G00000069102 [Anoplocephala perfoliata]
MHEALSEPLAVHIQSIVEFAKALPHFNSLSQPDQLSLLKGAFPELWIAHSARFISTRDQKLILWNGAAVSRADLEFVYTPNSVVEAFKFAEDFCSLNLNEIEIGLYCAILLTKPDRIGLVEVAKVAAINEQFQSALRYQLEARPEPVSSILEKLTAATAQLTQFSDMMRKVMTWFQKCWYSTKLSPLHAEIYDIPQSPATVAANAAQAQAYNPVEFQNSSYVPIGAPMLYGAAASSSYSVPKQPQSMLHYQQYAGLATQPDYIGMYNAQGNYYPNPTDYTDGALQTQQLQQQQFVYAPCQERWHSSAFEPYSTDMPTLGKSYTQEARSLDTDMVTTEVSRDDIATSGTSRKLSLTASPGVVTGEVMQGLGDIKPSQDVVLGFDQESENRDILPLGANTIVSSDDPFALYQNVDIPIIAENINNGKKREEEHNQTGWNDEGEKGATGARLEMPLLTPAPEVMAAIERSKEPILKQEEQDNEEDVNNRNRESAITSVIKEEN